jgi:hypothetical protein
LLINEEREATTKWRWSSRNLLVTHESFRGFCILDVSLSLTKRVLLDNAGSPAQYTSHGKIILTIFCEEQSEMESWEMWWRWWTDSHSLLKKKRA